MDQLFAAFLGAVIAVVGTLAAVYMTHWLNQDAEKSRRRYETKERDRERGITAAKEALTQIDLIHQVFRQGSRGWQPPAQSSYDQYFRIAQLQVIGIDNLDVADVLNRIAVAYYHASMALELDEWTQIEYTNGLHGLARATVDAYIHGTELPAPTFLKAVEAETESNAIMWDERYEEDRQRQLEEKLKKNPNLRVPIQKRSAPDTQADTNLTDSPPPG